MPTEFSLEDVSAAIKIWRQTRKHSAEPLPEEIASHIRALAKHHTKSHIAAVLKMSGSAINKVLLVSNQSRGSFKITSRNKSVKSPRKIYSLKEHQAFCADWKRSGMNMEQFCKNKDFSKSALYQWCRHLNPKKDNPEKSWVPVKAIQEREVGLDGTVLVELSLPNQSIVRIRISRSKVISFLQELSDATTVIR